jgi:hypothetical protein
MACHRGGSSIAVDLMGHTLDARPRIFAEAAYLTMWRRVQRGLPPAGFAVEPLA